MRVQLTRDQSLEFYLPAQLRLCVSSFNTITFVYSRYARVQEVHMFGQFIYNVKVQYVTLVFAH